jgi:hypothetical protein
VRQKPEDVAGYRCEMHAADVTSVKADPDAGADS